MAGIPVKKYDTIRVTASCQIVNAVAGVTPIVEIYGTIITRSGEIYTIRNELSLDYNSIESEIDIPMIDGMLIDFNLRDKSGGNFYLNSFSGAAMLYDNASSVGSKRASILYGLFGGDKSLSWPYSAVDQLQNGRPFSADASALIVGTTCTIPIPQFQIWHVENIYALLDASAVAASRLLKIRAFNTLGDLNVFLLPNATLASSTTKFTFGGAYATTVGYDGTYNIVSSAMRPLQLNGNGTFLEISVVSAQAGDVLSDIRITGNMRISDYGAEQIILA